MGVDDGPGVTDGGISDGGVSDGRADPSEIVDHFISNIESPLDYIMNVPGHHQVKNYILLRMKNLISTL